MRRDVLAATLASVWLAAIAAPATAQEPGDPDSATRTLVMPSARMAATFPADWRTSTFDMDEPHAWSAVDVDGRQWCSLMYWEGSTSSHESHQRWRDYESSDHQEVLELEPLHVPAGDAMYVAWRLLVEDRPPGTIAHEYHLPAPDGVLQVTCYAQAEPSPDQFLSIIETIGPVSADQPSTPFDPHVEMPSLRLALELPERWELSLGDETSTGFIYGGEKAFIAIDSTAADATRCELETLDAVPPSALITTGDWQAQVDELQAQVPEWASAEVIIAVDELPAGPATRVEIEWSDGASANLWTLADGERMIGLACSSFSRPPADRWRSIAETLDILPPAE